MPKAEKFGLGCLVGIWLIVRTVLLVIIAGAVLFEAILIVDSLPETVDVKENGEYAVYLQTLGSPGWPFGPQDCRIVLKKGGKTVCKENFTVHNDGKSLNGGNWSVSWDGSGVTVIISGEEQPDELIRLEYR